MNKWTWLFLILIAIIIAAVLGAAYWLSFKAKNIEKSFLDSSKNIQNIN